MESFPTMQSNEEKGLEKCMDEYLKSIGYHRKKIAKDGSCLFRAVAEQVLHCQSQHTKVRATCVEYLKRYRENYEAFIEGDFEEYLLKLEDPQHWVGEVEISALALMYKRDFIIFQEVGKQPVGITNNGFEDKVRLCFLNGNHYDSVYPISRVQTAAYCQSLLYELLYEQVCGVDHAVVSHHHRGNRGNDPLSDDVMEPCRSSDESDPEGESTSWASEGAGNSGPRHNGHHHKSQGRGRARLPERARRSLNPNLWRNIEYDLWVKSNIAQQKMDFRIAAGMQYTVGDRCKVCLEGRRTYSAYIQEVVSDSGPVTVFIEELGQRHTVDLCRLRPPSGESTWSTVAKEGRRLGEWDTRGGRRRPSPTTTQGISQATGPAPPGRVLKQSSWPPQALGTSPPRGSDRPEGGGSETGQREPPKGRYRKSCSVVEQVFGLKEEELQAREEEQQNLTLLELQLHDQHGFPALGAPAGEVQIQPVSAGAPAPPSPPAAPPSPPAASEGSKNTPTAPPSAPAGSPVPLSVPDGSTAPKSTPAVSAAPPPAPKSTPAVSTAPLSAPDGSTAPLSAPKSTPAVSAAPPSAPKSTPAVSTAPLSAPDGSTAPLSAPKSTPAVSTAPLSAQAGSTAPPPAPPSAPTHSTPSVTTPESVSAPSPPSSFISYPLPLSTTPPVPIPSALPNPLPSAHPSPSAPLPSAPTFTAPVVPSPVSSFLPSSLDAPVTSPPPSPSHSAPSASPHTSIPYASLPQVSLPQASLPHVSLPQASIPYTSIPQASLPHVSLPQASIPYTSIPQASLPHVSLPQASIPYASLPHVSLPQVSLPQASLPHSSLPQVSLPQASLPHSSLPQVSLPHTSLPQASLPQASLPHTSIPYTSIPQASLPHSSLPHVSLPQASLPHSSLPQDPLPSEASVSPPGVGQPPPGLQQLLQDPLYPGFPQGPEGEVVPCPPHCLLHSGEDLPRDINVLRFFYNLGVRAYSTPMYLPYYYLLPLQQAFSLQPRAPPPAPLLPPWYPSSSPPHSSLGQYENQQAPLSQAPDPPQHSYPPHAQTPPRTGSLPWPPRPSHYPGPYAAPAPAPAPSYPPPLYTPQYPPPNYVPTPYPQNTPYYPPTSPHLPPTYPHPVPPGGSQNQGPFELSHPTGGASSPGHRAGPGPLGNGRGANASWCEERGQGDMGSRTGSLLGEPPLPLGPPSGQVTWSLPHSHQTPGSRLPQFKEVSVVMATQGPCDGSAPMATNEMRRSDNDLTRTYQPTNVLDFLKGVGPMYAAPPFCQSGSQTEEGEGLESSDSAFRGARVMYSRSRGRGRGVDGNRLRGGYRGRRGSYDDRWDGGFRDRRQGDYYFKATPIVYQDRGRGRGYNHYSTNGREAEYSGGHRNGPYANS